MRRLGYFLLTIFVLGFSGFSFAEEPNTTEAKVTKPWNVTFSTETSAQLAKDHKKSTYYLGEFNQTTSGVFVYKIRNTDYSVKVNQPFYNTFFESGANDGGSFSVGSTDIDLKKASIGKVMPADVNLSAGLRLQLPTSRLTEGQNKSGFLGYLMPSLTASKTWTKFTVAGTLGSRFYLFEKRAWDIYSYEGPESTERTVVVPNYPNPIARQILTGLVSYQLTERVGLSSVTVFELDWRYNPQPNGPALGAPRMMVIPEVSVAATKNLELAMGVVVGGSALGAQKLRNVWLDNQKD